MGRPLVRMNAAEEEQIFIWPRAHGERLDVDAVVDRGRVVQARVTVGVTDGDVRGRGVVALVYRNNARRRESVNRRHYRRVDQPAVRERKKVEPVVNDVEVAGAFEDRRDVCAFRHLWVDLRIFRPPTRSCRMEPRRRNRVGRREQRDIVAEGDQPVGEKRGKQFPRAIVPWWRPPGDGRQHRNPKRPPIVAQRGLRWSDFRNDV